MEVGTYLIKSVAILSIFYIVYYLFLRKDTMFQANRHYLLGGIAAALVLPFLEFTKITYKEVLPMDSYPIFESETGYEAVYDASEAALASLDIWHIALLVYGIGIAFFAGRLLLQLFSLLRLIRNHPSEKRSKYTFVRVNETISPFSFFRYIVYNPQSHSEEELEMVLKHEEVHASQWHSLDIIIANIAHTLQWANPFSWWYKKSLQENLEFIADSETVAQLESKKQYQLTLVKASSAVLAPALTTQFYQSFIKKRIIMLNKSTSNRRNIWKVSIVLPLLALFLWSFNVKEVVEYKEVSPKPSSSIEKKSIPLGATSEETDKANNAVLGNEKESSTVEIKNEGSKQNRVAQNQTSSTVMKPNEATPINNAVASFQNLAMTAYNNPSQKTNATFSAFNKRVSKMMSAKEFRVEITKNTTDAELDAIKAKLREEYDIDMSYSVRRNSNKEITSLSISYSSQKGKNGSYSVNDDGPIENFSFFIKDNGESGFWSEAHEKRLKKRMENMEERNAERVERLAKRTEELEERRGEMATRSKSYAKRKELMEERVAKMKERMMEKEEEIEMRMMDREKEMKEKEEEIEERYEALARVSSSTGRGTRNYVTSRSVSGAEHAIIIDKDTTDETLADMKKKLAEKGIEFNYSKVRRNSNGEITRIKISTNNGKGSKTTITTDDDGPIEEILIEI